MQTYIILAKLTARGQEYEGCPTAYAGSDKDIREMGGKMVGFYSVMGEYD